VARVIRVFELGLGAFEITVGGPAQRPTSSTGGKIGGESDESAYTFLRARPVAAAVEDVGLEAVAIYKGATGLEYRSALSG